MKAVTPRCYDLQGPRELVIVTDEGWVPFNRESAHELAVSGMLLAFSPEHVERLQDEAARHTVAAAPSAQYHAPPFG